KANFIVRHGGSTVEGAEGNAVEGHVTQTCLHQLRRGAGFGGRGWILINCYGVAAGGVINPHHIKIHSRVARSNGEEGRSAIGRRFKTEMDVIISRIVADAAD